VTINKNEIWDEFSQEIKADYQADGFFTAGKVTLSYRQWRITMDTYTSQGRYSATFTRIRAPYKTKDGFRFNIYRAGMFTWIERLCAGQTIKTGDPLFDKRFILQGSPEEDVQRLLENTEIRELIQNQKDIHLQARDNNGNKELFNETLPQGVHELSFQTRGVIKDKERLKELFDLFPLILTELSRMGSASEDAPQVTPG
jgi:hypothetical protein